MPDIVIVEESDVREYFRQQLIRKVKNGRRITHGALGDELEVAQSTITRNAGRLRRGEPLASVFHKKLEARLVAQHLEAFRIEHLRLLGKSREKSLRDKELRERDERSAAQKKAEELANRIRAKEEKIQAAERLRARQMKEKQGRQNRARDALKPWRNKLLNAGIFAQDDDELHGDARELVEGGVTDITYASDGAAFVALAPDDYEFACGLTASELRTGISAQQRMHKDTVPAGSSRPDMIGNRPAHFVPLMLYPDSEVFYGSDFSEILEWDVLTTKVAKLAKGTLPRLVSPGDVALFEQLMRLECQSQYTFEGSVLGASPDIRLRELKRWAVPLHIMKYVRIWLKWGAFLLMLGLLIWIVWKGLQWALPRAWNSVLGAFHATGEGLQSAALQLVSGFNSAISWFVEISPIPGLIAVCTGIVALVVWWVWPKANDKPGMARHRLTVVCVSVVIVVVVVVALSFIISEIAARLSR